MPEQNSVVSAANGFGCSHILLTLDGKHLTSDHPSEGGDRPDSDGDDYIPGAWTQRGHNRNGQ